MKFNIWAVFFYGLKYPRGFCQENKLAVLIYCHVSSSSFAKFLDRAFLFAANPTGFI